MSGPIKVVARYSDGRVMRGTTDNFWPTRPSFHLAELGVPAGSPTHEVVIAELKAVFIVRSFEGNPNRDERPELDGTRTPGGTPLRVVFKDGETLVGTSMSVEPAAQGFFMFPADPKSNNERVYVVNASVDRIERTPAAAAR